MKSLPIRSGMPGAIIAFVRTFSVPTLFFLTFLPCHAPNEKRNDEIEAVASDIGKQIVIFLRGHCPNSILG
jgi:hypothetical protein